MWKKIKKNLKSLRNFIGRHKLAFSVLGLGLVGGLLITGLILLVPAVAAFFAALATVITAVSIFGLQPLAFLGTGLLATTVIGATLGFLVSSVLAATVYSISAAVTKLAFSQNSSIDLTIHENWLVDDDSEESTSSEENLLQQTKGKELQKTEGKELQQTESKESVSFNLNEKDMKIIHENLKSYADNPGIPNQSQGQSQSKLVQYSIYTKTNSNKNVSFAVPDESLEGMGLSNSPSSNEVK